MCIRDRLWTACATLAGGKPVHYICDEESEWYPDIDDIRKKINDRTKAIVIINPNNPTGALYPKEVLEQIVQVAREHQDVYKRQPVNKACKSTDKETLIDYHNNYGK